MASTMAESTPKTITPPTSPQITSATDNNVHNEKKSSHKRWYPLESNPTLLNRYISNLGFSTAFYQFMDVYSTEEWALSMIPPGTVAVVMLYPITEVQETHRKQEAKELFGIDDKDDTEANPKTWKSLNSDVWFTKQRIGNACGTIGVLHALANLPPPIQEMTIEPQSWLHRFYQSTPAIMSPLAKAELLESNEEIESKHDAATSDGANQTSRGKLEDKVHTHFVALVNVKGGLYELDGRKEGPIRHGDTTDAAFLKDACQVVKAFMDRDPEEMKFTILALAPSQD